MYVTYLKKFETVHEVRYTCKQDKGANKYWALKRLTHGGDSGQYTCIQVRQILQYWCNPLFVEMGDTGRATAHWAPESARFTGKGNARDLHTRKRLRQPGMCSIRWILAVLYGVGVNASIVMLWENQSRHAWIGTKFSKLSIPQYIFIHDTRTDATHLYSTVHTCDPESFYHVKLWLHRTSPLSLALTRWIGTEPIWISLLVSVWIVLVKSM